MLCTLFFRVRSFVESRLFYEEENPPRRTLLKLFNSRDVDEIVR